MATLKDASLNNLKSYININKEGNKRPAKFKVINSGTFCEKYKGLIFHFIFGEDNLKNISIIRR